MNKVIIHCKNSLYEFITNSGLDYIDQGNEIDVIVDDVAYTVNGTIYQITTALTPLGVKKASEASGYQWILRGPRGE